MSRGELAARWTRGAGIEIGALHRPWPLPGGATVSFVDRFSTEELRERYPELEPVGVDVVADTEAGLPFADASLDFVLASHVIAFLENPLAALEEWRRVLRPGGALLLAGPDPAQDLDADRPRTSFEHLMADRREGPARSRAAHYREWAALVDLPLGFVEADGVEAHAAELERRGEPLHFHVLEPDVVARAVAESGLRVGVVLEPASEWLMACSRG